MIVTFSGTDGSGKSTQIEKMTSILSNNNKTYRYIWGRGGYTPGFTLIKRLARIFLGKKAPTAGNSVHREQLLQRSSVSKTWLTIATLDLILYYGIYLRFLNLRYDIVLCDRYVKDTEIDFEHHHNKSFNKNGPLWKLLVLSIPKPHCQFLLYVPVHVSQERSKLKGEPFPDSPKTLEYRLTNYLSDERFPSSIYNKIDCTQSLEVIHNQIVSIIDNQSK